MLPMQQPSPSYSNVVSDFKDWVNTSSRKGLVISAEEFNTSDTQYRRDEFLPYSKLRDYFIVRGNLKKLLNTVAPHSAQAVEPIVRASFLKCFAILLFINEGQHIQSFVEHEGLEDKSLPFTSETPPEGFPDANIQTQALYSKFKDQQWRFCAPNIKIFHNRKIKANHILPFEGQINSLSNKGSSLIRSIHITEEYDDLAAITTGKQTSHTYVLKTYDPKDPESENLFSNEVKAFTSITRKSFDHIIGYFGCFRQNGVPCILLEFADGGSLESYFIRHHTGLGTSPQGVHLCRQFAQLFAALELIHNVSGSHQDIKPSNILVCNVDPKGGFECTLKIADLGLSQFGSTLTHSGPQRLRHNYGTKAYSAPECSRLSEYTQSLPMWIDKRADVFSLTAVCSEFATWAESGHSRLVDYRLKRQRQLQHLKAERQGQAFHNGNQILTSVRKQHNDIMNRANNQLISKFVIGIARGLADNPNDRPDAITMNRDIDTIIDNFTSNERNFNAFVSKRNTSGSSEGFSDQETDLERKGHQSQFWEDASPAHRPIKARDSIHQPGLARQRSGYSPTKERSTYEELRDAQLTMSPAHTWTSASHAQAATNGKRLSKEKRYSDKPQEVATRSFEDPEGSIPRTPSRAMSPQHYSPNYKKHISNSSDYTESPQPDQEAFNAPNIQSPGLNNSQGKHQPPRKILKFDELDRWIKARKADKSWGSKLVRSKPTIQPLTGKWHLNELKARDHILIVDSSNPMTSHQTNTAQLIYRLVHLLKVYDNDGVDLYFTQENGHVKPSSGSDAQAAVIGRRFSGLCNMLTVLHPILADYEAKLQRERDPISGIYHHETKGEDTVKPVNIYILTTGVWTENSDVTHIISHLVTNLEAMRARQGQFAIQFIRFGDSDHGGSVLRYLDDKLDLPRDVVDVVDYESQDVWKMLCGAQNKGLD